MSDPAPTPSELPGLDPRDPRLRGLGEMVAIMDRLRGEGGCPWDRVQDERSLRPFLLEETHELLEALDEGDRKKIREELGDVLFQVVFHARLAQERGEFTIGDVGHGIATKLFTRHPHVFSDVKVQDVAGVLATWERHKKREGRASALDGVPGATPALSRAQRLQEKAARVGFDWKDPRGPVAKLEEEIAEVKEAIDRGDGRAVADEIGDLLFAVVNLARHLGGNAEDSLRGSARKFERRFRRMEAKVAARGEELSGKSLEELDALWDEAKREERAGPG